MLVKQGRGTGRDERMQNDGSRGGTPQRKKTLILGPQATAVTKVENGLTIKPKLAPDLCPDCGSGEALDEGGKDSGSDCSKDSIFTPDGVDGVDSWSASCAESSFDRCSAAASCARN